MNLSLKSVLCSIALFLAVGFAGTVTGQSSSSNCFVAEDGRMGCDNAYCEMANCAVDPYCCETEWDGVCVDGNLDFGGSLLGSKRVCPGDCLATGHGAGCSNPDCEDKVCEIDSACCSTDWNNACVNLALDSCGFPTFELEGTEFCFPIIAKNGNIAVTCLGPDLLKPLDANPPANKKPTVFAGPNQTITLPPTDTVSLTPTVTDDGLPTPPMLTYNWSQTGGTTTGVIIASPTSKDTNVSFTTPDVYTFEITANDGELNNSDSVQVTVTAPSPDYVVDTVIVSNGTPNTGENFTIDATVKNVGMGQDPGGGPTLRYYQSDDNTITTDDTEIGTDEVDPLPAGASNMEDISVSIADAGTYFIGACVDPVTGETTTNNQCFTPGVMVEVGLCGGEALEAGETCFICRGNEVIFGDDMKVLGLIGRTTVNCDVPPSPHIQPDIISNCSTTGCHDQ